MTPVGVLGVSGYAGYELLRLLAGHPEFRVAYATGDTAGGQLATDLYPSLAPAYDGMRLARFDVDDAAGLEVVFSALPNGPAEEIVPALLPKVGRIVDLSADFRLRDPALYPEFYGGPHLAPHLLAEAAFGIPELFRDSIRGARLVAAPGCYVTAGALALAPFVRAGAVDPNGLIVDAASGVSGAGKGKHPFGVVDSDFSAYGLLTHRHTPEMEQAVGGRILFTPHLAPMTRGILATCYARPTSAGPQTTDEALEILRTAYADEPFVVVSERSPSTKSTRGANTAHLTARVDPRTGWLLALCAIDNMVKGAAGQAVQCANVAFGIDETLGLPRVGVGLWSVTAARGFVAAGIAAGIKPSGDLDLSLVTTDDGRPGAAAGVFTSNKATAAPVIVSRRHLAATGGRAAGVVLSSGNANAATGDAGVTHAEAMCRAVAEGIGGRMADVLVCSTGLIGIPLPIDVILAGVPPLVAARSVGPDGGRLAAEAIMTTDTHAKQSVHTAGPVTVGGMAKGAAMLAPNMATMLAVITTDAELSPSELGVHLAAAVRDSFNALSVDGCTSTNDTVLVLSSGRAGRPSPTEFGDALSAVCADLAGQMAGDAEGATKVVRVRVTGAADDASAARGARRVAESQLVKCSMYGGDPYWGRVVSELGSAGIDFDMDRVAVSYGGIAVAQAGVAVPHDEAAVQAHMGGREIDLHADLGLGSGHAVILTNDLAPGYIDENMRTS